MIAFIIIALFSALGQTRCAHIYVLSACWVKCISIIHRTPTWNTGSLTCVLIFLHAYTHGGPPFIFSSKGLFVQSAPNFTPGKLGDRRKTEYVTVTHSCSHHARSPGFRERLLCLTRRYHHSCLCACMKPWSSFLLSSPLSYVRSGFALGLLFHV